VPELAELSLVLLILIACCSFLTGALHGATGMAGGIVMAAILSHLIGIKLAIPVMTCALIFSHTSRVIIYWRDADWKSAQWVLLFGCPMIVIGALIFTVLDPVAVAIVFALFLCSSFPVKYWARKNQIRTGPKLLAGASVVWGVLAGNVIGPGFFLAPFLLGTGMNRLAFAGTLASITLIMNLIKILVFSGTGLMSSQLFLLGVFVGVISIPGNWVGSNILRKMSDSDHRIIVDILTVIMILNFVYLAINTS